MNLRPTHLLSLFAAVSVGLATPAIAYGAPVTGEAPVQNAIGLTTDQHLVTFEVNDPWTSADIGAITGLVESETVVGIDYRIQDGLLYGLGSLGGVYSLDSTTAAATRVSQLTVPLEGTSWGVDFNTATDRLQVVSDSGQSLSHNLELDADPITIDGVTTVDVSLTYTDSVGPALGVSAIAYTNNVAGDSTTTSTTTMAFIDTNLGQAVIQSTLEAGPLVVTNKITVDPATDAGFDIYSTLENGVVVSSTGYAALSVAGVYGLFGIDLTTGVATEVCDFPDELQVTDLAVQLAPVQLAPVQQG